MTAPDRLCHGRIRDAAPYGGGCGFAPWPPSNRQGVPHGGIHRSRPTNHVGSPYVFVGDDVHIVPAVPLGRLCGTWANPHRRRHTQVPPYEHGRTADVGDVGRDRCVPPSVQVTMIPWCGDGRWPAAGGCAICGWRFGRWGISPAAAGGCFAGCGQREFRALRGATRGAAFGNRDLGNAPPVGKRCRRGILCQSKAQLRRHTGCMARSWAAAMAQKVRRHPQTHRW